MLKKITLLGLLLFATTLALAEGRKTVPNPWTRKLDFISGEVSYLKPVLEYVSLSTVVVQNNTGTLNQTKIVFPDGDIRTVTEAAGGKTARYFDITQTATFTSCGSGTERTGLYTGISESTNTWYAIYAVKSQCTSGSANFTLVGTTLALVQANYATLNTNFGADDWVYLGLIRNGNNDDAQGDILNFVQAGSITTFRGVADTANAFGTILASASSADATFTYAAGMGVVSIPSTINHLSYGWEGTANAITIHNPASANEIFITDADGSQLKRTGITPFLPASLGLKVNLTTNEGGTTYILLNSFIDSALALNTSP